MSNNHLSSKFSIGVEIFLERKVTASIVDQLVLPTQVYIENYLV